MVQQQSRVAEWEVHAKAVSEVLVKPWKSV